MKSVAPSRFNIRSLAGRNILLPLTMLATVIFLFWRVFKYPFIQDDWLIIGSIIESGNLAYLSWTFSDLSSLFFRPVGRIFFQVIYNLWGLNPFGFHLAFLTVHFINSLLVVAILNKISGDRFVSWLSGFLYAAAMKIHIDPLFWMAGFYDIGGAFFFFFAILLFIDKKIILSLVVYVLALFTKESALALLPILFLTGIFSDGPGSSLKNRLIGQAEKLRWHISLFVAYLLLRSKSISEVSMGEENPYDLHFAFGKIFENLNMLLNWAVEAINPFIDIQDSSHAALFLGIILIIVILLKFKSKRSMIALLCAWALIGILPVLFLADHLFRYYITYSLPPFFCLMLISIRDGLGMIAKSDKLFRQIIAVATVASVISSSYYLSNLDKLGFGIPTMTGSNNLIRKGAIVKMTQDYLLTKHPVLPQGTTILFNWIPTVSFGNSHGPRIWYGDTSINVYEIRHIIKDSIGIYPKAGDASMKKRYFDMDKTLFIAFHGDYLRTVSEDQFFQKGGN